MRRRSWIAGLIFVLGLVGACGGDDTANDPADNNQTPNSSSQPDAGGDTDPQPAPDGGDTDPQPDPDAGDTGDTETDTCVPVTQCPEDACGEVDDGCGGTLDCGACPCQDGVAEESTCGECGLGKRVCESGETGFGTCQQADLPGVTEDSSASQCAGKLIFVEQGASGGDGLMESPYGDYATAVQEASAGQTIILGGTDAYEEPLELKEGVSVMGGYGSSPNFGYVEGRKAKIDVSARTGEATYGLKGDDIAQSTVVSSIEITTADADAGQNNYGVYLVDSPEVTLKGVVVDAGRGGEGADGEKGEAGASGGDGASTLGRNINLRDGQPGGTNPECPEANGGDGGDGAKKLSTIVTVADDGERTVHPVEGADGGTGGEGSLSTGGKNGDDGEDAPPLTEQGQHGAGGQSGGRVDGDLWIPEGQGEDGQDGMYGAGGGGGGGAWHGEEYEDSSFYYHGPGGAGGGAGGCAGTGGTGGKPGGGSFGLFLVRSDITIVDSEFRSDLGGEGGAGGIGGLGGLGGEGGFGNSVGFVRVNGDNYYTGLEWSSGDGGNGADGSAGGNGGGGAGGVSYGGYCYQSSTTVEGQTLFEAGGKARGGPGGSGGNAGADGVSRDDYQCQ